jgi:uncharacterized membrane protein YkvI
VKTFFTILKTSFLIAGTIIGAGYISGAELIGFFGRENFLLPLLFATFLTAVVFIVAFSASKKLGREKKGLEDIFGSQKLYKASTCITSLIFTASMLAGVDAMLNSVFYLGAFQFGSIIVVILISIFSKYGVKGMERINLILMPLIIITINALIFSTQKISFTQPIKTSFGGITKGALYVFMNAFVCLPVMRETAENKSKKTLFAVSVIVAIIVGVQALIILTAINNSGVNAKVDMPLYIALFNGGFNGLYFLSMVFCAITSAFSAYYPLYTYAKGKFNGFGVVVSAILTLILAKMGLDQIVRYAYPVVGGFGVLFFIRCCGCIKAKTYAYNKVRLLTTGDNYVKKEKEQKQGN